MNKQKKQEAYEELIKKMREIDDTAVKETDVEKNKFGKFFQKGTKKSKKYIIWYG